MRSLVIVVSLPFALALAAPACGSSAAKSGFTNDGGKGASGGAGSGGALGAGGAAGTLGSGGSGGTHLGNDSGPEDSGTVKTKTVIYANTDSALYTLDPSTMAVALIGSFSESDVITDVAVNAEGAVYVNSESKVFLATIPTTADGGIGTGTVTLSSPLTIGGSDQRFYALAFAPKGFLGAGETLVGGDSNGEVWSIDPTSGATQDLGNFGPVPSSSKYFALSGDMVFYTASGTPTGLATIRECTSSECTTTDDYLAGIDMTALANAYTSKTPAASLLAGIYGGSSSSAGPGTGFGEVYGLGAWEGNVYGFTRIESSHPAALLTIDTSMGTGGGTGTSISTSFGFKSDGWSGAGVATTTTITIMPPPPPPK